MGFLTEIYLNNYPKLESLIAGQYEIEERVMLTVKVFRRVRAMGLSA